MSNVQNRLFCKFTENWEETAVQILDILDILDIWTFLSSFKLSSLVIAHHFDEKKY